MTGTPPEPDSILTFTRGDRVAAEQLRRSLVAIRDHLGNEALAARVDGVIQGQATLRELTRDPVMLGELGRAMDRFASEWAQMSPDERAALAEQGQRETHSLREEIGLPPESDPAPVGEFGPALTEPPAD